MNTEQLLEWASQEITRLRRDNQLLSERVRTLDIVERLLYGQQGGCMQEDYLGYLIKEAQEIRDNKTLQNRLAEDKKRQSELEKEKYKDDVKNEIEKRIPKIKIEESNNF